MISENKQLKYFKNTLLKLSHEQAFLNADGDKISVYYGGHHQIFTKVLAEPGANQITQHGSVTRLHYPNGKQVDIQLSITISEYQIASITNLIRHSASTQD